MDKREPLTPKQLETLDFINEFIRRRRYSPSFTEISDGLGIHYSAGWEKCQKLVEKGYLEKSSFKHRTLQIIE